MIESVKALKPNFATFWHGDALSPYELACLYSFVSRGYRVTVYSYEPVADLPDWLIAKDAREITPPDTLNAFVVEGKPSLAHFSDYFRFVMFVKTDEVWIDTDIVLLRDFDLDASKNLMGLEGEGKICTAVLRLTTKDPRTQKAIEVCESKINKDMKWGETGPRLLTALYKADEALPQHVFYPVHHTEFYKIFVPALREECEALCKDGITLHLWNHIIVEMGVYKKIGPPVGSYLYHLFESFGGHKFFNDFYPPAIMKNLVHNMVEKPSEHAGVTTLLRMLIGSFKLSIMRRLGMVW